MPATSRQPQYRKAGSNMKTNRKQRVATAVLAALATIGSLHAPLHASETSTAIDEVRAEIVRTGYEAAPAQALERSAAAALTRAEVASQAELALDLELKLGARAALVVANAEPQL